MEQHLIVIEKKNARELFTTPSGLDHLLDKLTKDALIVAPDTSTAKGRQEIKSAAYRVAQTKTYIDKVGKEITDELKALPKIVDENRRQVKERLQQLQDEVRKPLTEWEEEQARIEAAKKAEEEAKALAEQIERDHEIALLMNAEFDRKKKEEAERIERERLEREAQIAREAEERAKREAEAKIKAEQEAAQRAIIEAKLAQERAEQQAKEAAEKAEREAKEAEQRRVMELKAQEERLKREAEEKRRHEEDQARQEAAAKAKAEANKAHQKAINSEIVKALMSECGLTEEVAKKVVVSSVRGLLGRLTIDYSVRNA